MINTPDSDNPVPTIEQAITVLKAKMMAIRTGMRQTYAENKLENIPFSNDLKDEQNAGTAILTRIDSIIKFNPKLFESDDGYAWRLIAACGYFDQGTNLKLPRRPELTDLPHTQMSQSYKAFLSKSPLTSQDIMAVRYMLNKALETLEKTNVGLNASTLVRRTEFAQALSDLETDKVVLKEPDARIADMKLLLLKLKQDVSRNSDFMKQKSTAAATLLLNAIDNVSRCNPVDLKINSKIQLPLASDLYIIKNARAIGEELELPLGNALQIFAEQKEVFDANKLAKYGYSPIRAGIDALDQIIAVNASVGDLATVPKIVHTRLEDLQKGGAASSV